MGHWYRLKLEPDEETGNIAVDSPDFPELHSFGETEADALHWGLDAVQEVLAGRMHYHEDIPPPRARRPRGRAVELPLQTYLKVALYIAMREAGISNSELARRLEVHRPQVNRLFRLDHNSRIGQLEAAFKAIGVPLSIEASLPSEARKRAPKVQSYKIATSGPPIIRHEAVHALPHREAISGRFKKASAPKRKKTSA